MNRSTIVREGMPFILPPLLLTLLLLGFKLWIAALPLAVLTLFLAWFFRKPKRRLPDERDSIVSPADGTVLGVKDIEGDFTRRVDIFMSVFNVHVNVAPVTGTIAKVQYRRGKKHPASKDEASRENESNYVEMTTPRGPVAFKQIAGILARRILFNPLAGESLEQGEVVGMIKFGSRVEVFLPPNTTVTVSKGDKVNAKKTILARWT